MYNKQEACLWQVSEALLVLSIGSMNLIFESVDESNVHLITIEHRDMVINKIFCKI
jgi:hypothetical protein